jgi:hypothetical protein
MGYGRAVDGVGRAFGFGKMEEAADVIVLVIAGEDTLEVGGGKAEGGKSDRLAIFTGEGRVTVDEFAKGEHGSASNCLLGHNSGSRDGVYCRWSRKKRI